MAESKDKSSIAFTDIQSRMCDFCLANRKKIQLTRRYSENLGIIFRRWRQHRSKSNEIISFLKDTMNCLPFEDSYTIFLQYSIDLREYLNEDIQMVEELISMFDEYLDNAVQIKLATEEVMKSNISDQIVFTLKTEYLDHFSTLQLSGNDEGPTMEDITAMLKLLAELANTTGGVPLIFERAAEDFDFLTRHWDILQHLNKLNDNKGPILDILPIPERFCVTPEDEVPSYYDLSSNISLPSYAIAMLDTFLSMSEKELQSKNHKLLEKLQTLIIAMTDRTGRMDAVAELLITET